MKNPAASCRVSAFKQTFPSVITRNPSTEFTLSEAEGLRINSVTKQSDTKCHSKPCPERRRRSSEESKQIASLGYVVAIKPALSPEGREGSQGTVVLRNDS